MLLENNNIYLACGYIDARKSIDGLASIVQLNFDLDPFNNCYFVFCNKNRNKLKILYWENNGFWLYYKRLEKGKFNWPESNKQLLNINQRELRWLLDGLSITQPKAHKRFNAKYTT